MKYSRPIQMLVDEHALISSVLDALEAAVARIGRPDALPPSFFEQAADFFAGFADRCHHAKEETHLFPRLEARGIPRDGGPVGCMLSEHEAGRAHIRALRAAAQRVRQGDSAALTGLRQEALAYAELLRQHILKENQVLFLMAEDCLSNGDKDELERTFAQIERDASPPETHDKYLDLAGRLRTAAGLGLSSGNDCCRHGC